MPSKRNRDDLGPYVPEWVKHVDQLIHKYILRHEQYTTINGAHPARVFCKCDPMAYWEFK